MEWYGTPWHAMDGMLWHAMTCSCLFLIRPIINLACVRLIRNELAVNAYARRRLYSPVMNICLYAPAGYGVKMRTYLM